MGVWILHDQKQELACLCDSVTEWAFGPVFHPESKLGLDAGEIADLYIAMTEKLRFRDPRSMNDEDHDKAREKLHAFLEKHRASIVRAERVDLDELKERLRAE